MGTARPASALEADASSSAAITFQQAVMGPGCQMRCWLISTLLMVPLCRRRSPERSSLLAPRWLSVALMKLQPLLTLTFSKMTDFLDSVSRAHPELRAAVEDIRSLYHQS